MNPTQPSTAFCCPTGLSAVIEGDAKQGYPGPTITPGTISFLAAQQGGSLYHNFVHGEIEGLFINMLSPSFPAHWLWHASIDQIWKD